MDLDLFLENDIPTYLDEFERDKQDLASEAEIETLLNENPQQQADSQPQQEPPVMEPLVTATPSETKTNEVKIEAENITIEQKPSLFKEGSESTDSEEPHVYRKALHHLKHGDHEKAIELLRGLLHKRPNHLAYRSRLDEAMQRAPKRTYVPPQDAFLNAYHKASQILKEGDVEEARRQFLDLARQKPHNLAVQLRLDEIASMEGEHD